MWKSPKTTQEKRHTQTDNYFMVIDGYMVKVRHRRTANILPDGYDEERIANYGNRSWKRHRRTRRKNK